MNNAPAGNEKRGISREQREEVMRVGENSIAHVA
jgi:hypothetical protein